MPAARSSDEVHCKALTGHFRGANDVMAWLWVSVTAFSIVLTVMRQLVTIE